MSSAYLGIDISKAKFDVVLLINGKSLHKVCPNKPEGFADLASWLVKKGVSELHACMEATGTYGEDLALFLHEAGVTVSVVNPACIKAFAQSALSRTKTDKTDAALIARYCQAQRPGPWSPTPAEIRDLQALVRRYEVLQEMHHDETNRLKSGIKEPQVRASVISHIDYLEEEMRRTKVQIQEHIERHSTLRKQRELLVSIPGIAELTAAKLLAEIGDITAYSSARQVAAYAGLTPRQHHSGSSVRGKAHLSKTGNSRLRVALYMPALVAKKYNPVIKDFCRRLQERGKNPMAVIGAAMRKLLHLAYGVLKSGKPFDPHYALAA